MQHQSYKFVLNSKEFEIPSNISRLHDMSPNIYLSFISEGFYTVQSDVSEEVFKSFIKYLVTNEVPNIDITSIMEYSQLSQEFNLMHSLIFSIEHTKEFHVHQVEKLNNPSIQNKSEIEKFIAKSLDGFIINCGEQLLCSSIHSLYRIFNHSERSLTQHNLCYILIKDHFSRTQNPSIFIILQFLDGNKLSKENLDDCIKSRDSRHGILPRIEFSYISELESQVMSAKQESRNQVEQMQQKINEIESLLEEERQMREKEIQKKDEDINELKKIIRDLRFYTNCEIHSDKVKYHFFVPTGMKWEIDDIEHCCMTYQDQTIDVSSSDTWTNDKMHRPSLLFVGKKEIEGGGKWCSNDKKPEKFIQFDFKNPIVVTVILMTSRDEYYSEAPTVFEVLARNGSDEFEILKRFEEIEWSKNERKIFLINNSSQFTSYKIRFINAVNKDFIGMSELNLGESI